jgi:hypothetical protein
MAATPTPKATVSITSVASAASVSKATTLSILAELKKLDAKGYTLDMAIALIQSTDLA